MSLHAGIPAAFVRKHAKKYGTCTAIEGVSVEGRRVVVVEDVVTTGGQLIESVRLLRAAGAVVDKGACLIWRGADLSRMKYAGLELHWLLTPDEFVSLAFIS